MNVNTPGMEGVEVCRSILQQNAEVKIIAVSVRNDGCVPYQLLKLGFVSLRGASVNEMSEDMALSDKTINTYRHRLYNKWHILPLHSKTVQVK